MAPTLDSGIATRLYSTSPDDTEFFDQHYVLQVLGIKEVNQAKSGMLRCRIILSDGLQYLQAMHTSTPEESVAKRGIEKWSIVRAKLSCSFVQEKRLLVISDVEFVEQHSEKIGDPANLNKSGDDSPAVGGDNKPASSSNAPQAPAQTKPGQQKQPQRAGSSGHRNIHPIEGLSPYGNSWTIKARCTQKTEMKEWANARGDGKLFSVTLMDETGEIRGTAFNTVAEALYQKFHEDKVYFVSKARVNLAKKQFSNVANDYELSFDQKTEVEECKETTNLPMIKYNFTSLDKLNDISKDATCDVLGLVKEVGSIGEITSKATQRTTKKRELTLVDESGFSVRLTLWGKHAENYDHAEADRPVIAFKGVRVGDFGGRSLSMVASSIMTVNPDLPQVYQLRGWFDGEGKDATFNAHSRVGGSSGMGGGFNRNEMKSINEVKEAEMGQSDKVEFFSSRATIMHIKNTGPFTYPACGTCQKKWRCDKCNKSMSTPEYRYILSIAVADWSGQAWYNGFNDVGQEVFGITGNEFVEKQAEGDAPFNAFLQKACGRAYNFACRAKQDSWNDTVRVRYGISRIQKLDMKEECNVLIDLLNTPWGKGQDR
ncbi:replication factor-a protein [Hymenopellis radicata]|nr:replication factor-a protein [Hymenopellis radicata]